MCSTELPAGVNVGQSTTDPLLITSGSKSPAGDSQFMDEIYPRISYAN